MTERGEVVRLTDDVTVPDFARGRLGMVENVLTRSDGTSDIAVQINMGLKVIVPSTAIRSPHPIH